MSESVEKMTAAAFAERMQVVRERPTYKNRCGGMIAEVTDTGSLSIKPAMLSDYEIAGFIHWLAATFEIEAHVPETRWEKKRA